MLQKVYPVWQGPPGGSMKDQRELFDVAGDRPLRHFFQEQPDRAAFVATHVEGRPEMAAKQSGVSLTETQTTALGGRHRV